MKSENLKGMTENVSLEEYVKGAIEEAIEESLVKPLEGLAKQLEGLLKQQEENNKALEDVLAEAKNSLAVSKSILDDFDK